MSGGKTSTEPRWCLTLTSTVTYADYQIMGAVAGAVVPEEVGRFAYRQGLFVLAQNGDTMEICNDDRFAPLTW